MIDSGRAPRRASCGLLIGIVALFACGPAAAVETCRTVHGRMSLYNGAPSARIWIVGTKRVLGVSSEGGVESKLPEEVKAAWGDPFKNDLFGDFRVCAVTAGQPGQMQIVRLEGGAGLRRVTKFP